MMKSFVVLAWGSVGVLALSTAWLFGSAVLQQNTVLSAPNADPRLGAFKDWPKRYQEIEGDRNYMVRMSFVKGLSNEFTQAHGETVVNFETGEVSTFIQGLPPLDEGSSYEVLLVDNLEGPGNSAALDTGDGGDDIVSLGTLDAPESGITLKQQLEVDRLHDFQVDLVMVRQVRADGSEKFVIGGLPDLFYKWNRAQSVKNNHAEDSPTPDREPAALTTDQATDLTDLIRKGEKLFFKETFKGNGRTCGTCHRVENNFTIDPKFIAKLSDRDPLFVAEFVPALSQNFENPTLMREYGLILENTNGFDPPETNFTMRSVPHTLALTTSLHNALQPLTTSESCSFAAPCSRTGWSGDGAPGDLTLRSFALGAVTQHFTKSLGRQDGLDFRLPTDEELDALEAFQLTLGRHEDLALPLPLKDPVVLRGQAIFMDDNAGKCNLCHGNAGANVGSVGPGGNLNFDTGFERLPDHPATSAGMPIPGDDGFGQAGNPELLQRDTFNTPPLVEAADTGPFFHNNALRTLEGSIAFYNSNAFNESDSARPVAEGGVGQIHLEATQIEAVAAFLRVINALENIRQTEELLDTIVIEQGADTRDRQKNDTRRLVLIRGLAENRDAIDVLDEVGLHPKAVALLEKASGLIERAQRTRDRDRNGRTRSIAEAKQNIKLAKDMLIN